MRRRNPISLLRTLAMIEGASFLVLLFVAMPLKYFAGVPMAVKVVGWIHGVLFAAVVMALVWTMIRRGGRSRGERWSSQRRWCRSDRSSSTGG